jgi:hypothetical protein
VFTNFSYRPEFSGCLAAQFDSAFEFVQNQVIEAFLSQQNSAAPAVIRTAKFLPILKKMESYLQSPQNFVLQETHSNETAGEFMYFIYDTGLED